MRHQPRPARFSELDVGDLPVFGFVLIGGCRKNIFDGVDRNGEQANCIAADKSPGFDYPCPSGRLSRPKSIGTWPNCVSAWKNSAPVDSFRWTTEGYAETGTGFRPKLIKPVTAAKQPRVEAVGYR